MKAQNALNAASLVILLLLTGWIYWPGLTGPVLLDDAANLERVQALVSDEGFALDVLTENRSGPLGRPVSMASFILDLYLFDGGVWGAKLTNVLIHLVTGLLVWIFSAQVFTALGNRRPHEFALWVAAMWLLAPLLVSTTLYMVQRMAQLSTLFTLGALVSYMQWRAGAEGGSWHRPWYLLTLVAVVLAVLSKENGVLAVPLLILVELTILQSRDHHRMRGRVVDQLRRLHLALLALGIVAVATYLALFFDGLVASYGGRDFTLMERLLTQPRILWEYAAQLFWVDRQLLGLYHDSYPFSTGLTEPRGTLWALAGGLLVLAVAFACLRWQAWRGVGFGILFFLIGHALESSIFALELYFEHRNYLPAVGLFIALVSALSALAGRLPAGAPWARVALAILLGHAAIATAAETQVWSSARVFKLVAGQRFPASVRANEALALEMASLGDAELALEYVARAEALDPAGGFRHRLTEAMVFCRASGFIPKERFMAWQLRPADFRNKLVNETSYALVRRIISGRCPGTDFDALADHWGEQVLQAERRLVTPKLFLSMAILENYLQRYEQALYHVEALLERSPNELRAHMMRLYFAGVLGKESAYHDSRVRLEAARDEGRLNAQQRYNLELITGQPGS